MTAVASAENILTKVTKSDLENMHPEDLDYIVNHLEEVWVETDGAVESKYLHKWDDLSEK